MSKIEVDQITQQSGTTLTVGGGACKTATVDATTVTIGRSGGTVSLASGATQSGFGRSGSVDWQTTPKTSTFTAVSGEGYFINQSSGITANLPAGSAGAIVAFSDYARNFATYNFTISPNGSEKIGGVAADLELAINGQALTLVYVDSTKGWINVQNAEDTEIAVAPAYIAATGGTITTVCTNFKVHTFTGPGTFSITSGAGPLSKLDYLVIAGGGGGGRGSSHGGGGGAGGYRESKSAPVSGCWSASPLASTTPLGPFSPGNFPVVVGGGGAQQSGAAVGNQGNDSSISTITSAGGGGGGRHPSTAGLAGGSGGGGGCAAGGAGNTPSVSPPQGNPGGTGGCGGHMSGGGGATAAGVNTPGTGAGGAGATSSITSSPVTRAGGGGGGSNGSFGPSPGGSGGGGAGSNSPSAGGCGSANSGSGGGGDGLSSTGGAGGSGVVIVRYRFQA